MRHASCCGPRSFHGSPELNREQSGYGWGGFFMRRGPFGEGPEGGFGVRRPLRVLAYKLELDEAQIAELARLLDEVKTERAQGEVDDRRTLSEFADALAGETFDAAKAGAAGDRRVAAATRLRDTVVRFLQQIHAILRPDQRARLAYLIRTGTLIV